MSHNSQKFWRITHNTYIIDFDTFSRSPPRLTSPIRLFHRHDQPARTKQASSTPPWASTLEAAAVATSSPCRTSATSGSARCRWWTRWTWCASGWCWSWRGARPPRTRWCRTSISATCSTTASARPGHPGGFGSKGLAESRRSSPRRTTDSTRCSCRASEKTEAPARSVFFLRLAFDCWLGSVIVDFKVDSSLLEALDNRLKGIPLDRGNIFRS